MIIIQRDILKRIKQFIWENYLTLPKKLLFVILPLYLILIIENCLILYFLGLLLGSIIWSKEGIFILITIAGILSSIVGLYIFIIFRSNKITIIFIISVYFIFLLFGLYYGFDRERYYDGPHNWILKRILINN